MDIKQSINIIKGLADISRMRIARLLKSRPHYVEEIATRLELAPSTVSFHLKKLEKAGLVVSAKEQYYIVYSINGDLLNRTLDELTDCEDLEAYHQEKRISEYRQKVLGIFFRDGRLEKMPVQKKKQLIIMDEFAALFEQGKEYNEQTVNNRIRTHCEDYCLIRRLLVEEGYMKRNRQIYILTGRNREGEQKNARQKRT